MFNWDDFQTGAGRVAGVAGALVSMRFIAGSIAERLVMAAGGALFSFFASEYVAHKLAIPEGLAGFLLGLFGMSILSRIWDWVQTVSIDGFIRSWFKIPPRQ